MFNGKKNSTNDLIISTYEEDKSTTQYLLKKALK